MQIVGLESLKYSKMYKEIMSERGNSDYTGVGLGRLLIDQNMFGRVPVPWINLWQLIWKINFTISFSIWNYITHDRNLGQNWTKMTSLNQSGH